MSGKKMVLLTSMMNSVRWLEEESHTVRLARASMDEGRMNGNIDTPTLSTVHATASALASRYYLLG